MYMCGLYVFHIQRWYVDGTVECFRGSHLILAVFAILVLALCVILIIIVMVINTGRLKVRILNYRNNYSRVIAILVKSHTTLH